MATMNISLPDPLREYVEERVEQGGYSTASEFFRELIREDRRRRAQDRLEELIEEALESGPVSPMTKDDWRRLREEAHARLRQETHG
jgi:antitoxin ParD1/3/4